MLYNCGAEAGMDSGGERRIAERVAQLAGCAGDYELLDRALDRKRQEWWEAHRESLQVSGPLPRQAYQMVLIECIGIDPAEVPVVYEDERKIVWRSYNFCPTLEACLRLGLDTRVVCRGANEACTESLAQRLDPRLRFSRNYHSGIRPYAPYCEESFELVE
jgi:hypothetical protein